MPAGAHVDPQLGAVDLHARPVAAAVKRLGAAVLVSAALLLGACGTAPTDAGSATGVGREVKAEGDLQRHRRDVPADDGGPPRAGPGDGAAGREERPARRRLKILADAVDATQTDEVTMMTSWLNSGKQADHGRPRPERRTPTTAACPRTGPEEIEALKTAEGRGLRDGVPQPVPGAPAQRGRDGAPGNNGGKNAEAKAFADRVTASRHGPDPADAQADEQLTCPWGLGPAIPRLH